MDIKLENVTKNIKGSIVLNNISMDIKPNVITGLSGINGSGKTMLMRTISGLILPSHGKVIIDEKTLGKDMQFPDSIGVLIENPSFLDTYSSFENLKFIAEIRCRIDDEQILSTIKRVGLNPKDKKKYKKYSLGMKQRLGIAAAIMEQPQLILLDEPTNALDSDGVEMIKAIVKEEKRRGANIIISCHDKTVLRELSDEIFYLQEGKITDYEKLTETERE